MATDTSGSSEGWRVDGQYSWVRTEAVSLADTYCDAYVDSDSNGYGNCLIYADSYAYCYTNGDPDNYT
jgi:hypothetical protein